MVILGASFSVALLLAILLAFAPLVWGVSFGVLVLGAMVSNTKR
jgi:hypothetical protein